ncbi:acetyltransferase, GNAT family protein [Trichomonas vaginalis G3]|uniref:Acetyltransferase, GNAT family protein n=1 Tax=Trichomonas vaginalis (strain ATCC PRA-98 / G3) TaxID=412133 RepID=A2FIG7_TRIV3|nr:acetyltransferase (GNAT) domain-containing protein [Trichomonas vaginalis G3]EAX95284.1 acetyltransferase, GNAT family protein [Trichomonas vaginalis G3]KAI5539341.1 acetyltransferase (GNAT) domain-containing protein [Trichomonas vaginalis G3]|eukprot:XP_001308214.1 acetyltransferase, GNAT family protein [Trichomonas vaginalis G3]
MIRPCTLSDIPALQKISRATFKDTFMDSNTEEDMAKFLDDAYNIPKLTREMNNKNSQFYFGLLDGEVAGYLKVNMENAQSEAKPLNYLEIERLYIDKKFKRRGLGKILMNYAETIAKIYRKDHAWLGVWEHNNNALAFYKSMGYNKVGAHTFVVGTDAQTDLIYEKKLE